MSGTIAYVLTELAFWAVAFPVAAALFTQANGHAPDLFNSGEDRAAVIASIFVGANVARLAVPLRFGVALAAAPWVDENIVQRFGGDSVDVEAVVEEVPRAGVEEPGFSMPELPKFRTWECLCLRGGVVLCGAWALCYDVLGGGMGAGGRRGYFHSRSAARAPHPSDSKLQVKSRWWQEGRRGVALAFGGSSEKKRNLSGRGWPI